MSVRHFIIGFLSHSSFSVLTGLGSRSYRNDRGFTPPPTYPNCGIHARRCQDERDQDAVGENHATPVDPDKAAWNPADATVPQKGRHQLPGTLEIPRSGVSLIVGQDAAVVAVPDAELTVLAQGHANFPSLIRVKTRQPPRRYKPRHAGLRGQARR
ncbi:MAG: hypothetical protein ACODAD_08740 [Planctomycetota bacterium]